MDQVLDPGETDYEERKFAAADFSGLDLSRHSFEGCVFSSCHFREMAVSGASFRSCAFENCEMVLVKLTQACLNEVAFRGCKIMGVNFAYCDKFGFSPSFEGSVLDSVAFFENHLRRARFVDCRIVNSDFTECDLREADFSGSSLERTEFAKCDLGKADFRASKGYSIDPAGNKLRGARFSLPEALSFLNYLGIKLED